VHDQDDVLLEPHRREQGIEVAAVIDEAVGAVGRVAGIAHADEIGGETASERQEIRNDVAPEIGRRRVAMEEDDRISLADIDIHHVGVEHRYALSVGDVFGRDGGLGHVKNSVGSIEVN